MLTADFDFELPDELVAQQPLPRGTSRLLVLPAAGSAGGVQHGRVSDLPAYLEPGDLVVVNDTRVVPARLFATGPGGARIELLLVEALDALHWEVLCKPGRRTRLGDRFTLVGNPESAAAADPISGEVVEVRQHDGRRTVRFSTALEPHLETIGHTPLPPYVKRADTAEDRERYQTVWAREPGAVAAPTAGLHFDEPLIERIRERGVGIASVTLHVGIGTFKPVTSTLVHEHRMESERYEVPQATADAIARARNAGGRVVAIGTTVVRTLESAARPDGTVAPGRGRTEIFLVPGATFRVVDRLLTNFHLPRSTLLMLLSAFAGRERVLAAYAEAIRERYRFYSYGDAMLVDRSEA